MKNRFEHESGNSVKKMLSSLPLIAFLVLFFIFCRGINTVSETTEAKQLESLDNALSRGIVQCYAVEGFYPPDLAYLKEHYGLTYNETLFWVDYQPIGSNIMPEYTIIRLK